MPRTYTSTAFRFSTVGNLESNPTLIRQRATSALSVAPNGTTFVTRREGAALAHYLVMPGTGSGDPLTAAKAVAARAEQVTPPDLSDIHSLAHLTMPAAGIPASNPQVNADLSAVVDAASSALRDGEWVGCSIRRPGNGELNGHKKWYDQYGSFQHHSKDQGAVLVSFFAGAQSPSQAQSLLQQVVGALPGFDMPRQAVLYRDAPVKLTCGVIGVLGLGYALAPLVVTAELPYSPAGYAVAAGAAGVIALSAFGVLPSRVRRAYARLSAGLIPPPAHRVIPAAKARSQRTDDQGNITQQERKAAYPLHPGAYLMGPVAPLAFVAPHAGAVSGERHTADRAVPPQLVDALGPLIGYVDGKSVNLTDEFEWRGVMALGAAGSGKSVLLQGLWGYDCARKTNLITRPSGQFNAMVAFDTKDGKSAAEYIEWARAAGMPVLRTREDVKAYSEGGKTLPPLVVINVADMNSQLGVELFPAQDSNRARRAVNAFKYIFGETSIGPESFATLGRVLTAAWEVDEAVAREADIPTGKSAIFYAGVLLGTRGDEMGVRLHQSLKTFAERFDAPRAKDAVDMLAPLYDPKVTASQRSNLTKAPQNKLENLIAAEQWWSRTDRLDWKWLLDNNASVVLNFGPVDGLLLDETQREHLSSLMLYTLHEEIKVHCVGWQDSGRLISIYADELKHIASTSPEVVNWARQDGRSSGVRLVVATQEPEQLEQSVRRTAMGLGTLVAFQQNDADVIRAVLQNISVDSAEWTPADVQQLPLYTAIIRTHANGQPVTAFTLPVAYFRDMRGEQFLKAHGSSQSAPHVAPPVSNITFATWDAQ